MKVRAIFIIIFVFMATSIAFADDSQNSSQKNNDLMRKIDTYLSGIEQSTSYKVWAELGEGAIPLLIQIANDKKQPPFKRARAIYALGAYGQRKDSFKLLSNVAKNKDALPIMRRAAARTLIFLWKENSLDIIEPIIKSADNLLKESIAKQLIYVKNKRAIRLLKKLKADKSPIVKKAAEESLNYLNKK